MPKVRVKKVYFDKVLDTYKEKVGEEFDVEDARANVLVEAGVCELVTEEQSDGTNEEDEQEDAREESEEEASEEGSETPEEPKKQTRGRRTSNK